MYLYINVVILIPVSLLEFVAEVNEVLQYNWLIIEIKLDFVLQTTLCETRHRCM